MISQFCGMNTVLLFPTSQSSLAEYQFLRVHSWMFWRYARCRTEFDGLTDWLTDWHYFRVWSWKLLVGEKRRSIFLNSSVRGGGGGDTFHSSAFTTTDSRLSLLGWLTHSATLSDTTLINCAPQLTYRRYSTVCKTVQKSASASARATQTMKIWVWVKTVNFCTDIPSTAILVAT